MEKKGKFLFGAFLFGIFIFLASLVSADFTNCWNKSGTSEGVCEAVSGCLWRTQAEDPWCQQSGGCCMDINCGIYVGNQAACTNVSDGLNCTWDPLVTMWYPNGTQSPPGGCMMNWTSGGGGWGGVSEGCWQYDGNKATCSAKSSTCKWTANNQNQDPWCYVKSLTDAKSKNPSATTTDIGCCQTLGCWSFDNNQSSCLAAFQGNCNYNSVGGWCNTKSAGEIITQENCTYAKQNLFLPYEWNGTACKSASGGGFSFYNDTDSCFSAGGWYNSTGQCVMPSGNFSGGSGGFMFAGEAHCWFADNQPWVCGNITGCAYCIAGTGPFGIGNGTKNICSGKQIGYCEGRDTSNVGTYDNANNTANLACGDIKLQSACLYGPLPSCNWNNMSAQIGSYCEAGAFSGKKSAPPAQYCEDPIAKNNYTICMQLANNFMMPCKWQNTTYPFTNCTFNSQAVFGSGKEKDFGEINNQFACTSAGGTWNTEYYIDGGILKQDAWCEMTGFFDIDQGKGIGNKGNCNTSCWSCEFQANGTAWGNVAVAESACVNSVLGYCKWVNDTTGTKAFNKLGWCDYPKEMEDGGAKDCSSECEGCNFMSSPKGACEASMAKNGTGCKWVNDTNNIKGGFCVDKTKKTCNSDCFSCLDTSACNASSLNCNWDPTFSLCSPNGFDGEICFNAVDDDADSLIDCADPDCGFDNFCGGSSFGGDCFAKTNQSSCNLTVAFSGLNCTWVNDTWNPVGRCDMPGANCWKFDNDLVACGNIPGCTNNSASMGTNAWCEMNSTKMDSASCWNKTNELSCVGASCGWKNNTWSGASAGSGWCEYSPMGVCMDLNSTSCSANTNCNWQQDNYSEKGGWCNVVCMNQNLSQSSCTNASLNGLCQWKNLNATCQPSAFMMMGSSGGGGGMTGCVRYNGNLTGCLVNSVTCTYKNDSFARNNQSVTEVSGWCMDKSEFEHFGELQGGVIELATDGEDAGVSDVVDINDLGMRVTDKGFDFGAKMVNISTAVMCNGQMIGVGYGGFGGGTPIQGNGNATTKFYWYLDTNGNSSDGCVAIPSSGSNLTGYDFLVSYSSRNTSEGIVETKQLMRCSNNVWFPTNALVTTSKKLSCGEIGGIMVALAKQDLESFSEYNKTALMKIFMSSANDTSGAGGSRTRPADSVGPGYYTPGTIDFGFVDCSNPLNAKDSKCKNFQKFGFNVFEECKNGVDDDENGLVDCVDPFCTFMPNCGGGVGFGFNVNLNDKTAPSVMFSEVEKLSDAALVRIDTNEPSNLSLDFFKNDSTCATINLNITLADTGSGYQANANFKPFHSIDLVEDTLRYSLINGTAYYYKIKVCDSSNNCANSGCSNFTTKTTSSGDKSFIFKIDLPAGYTVDIPALNKTNYNFTETFGGVVYGVGIKTNTSVTRKMNMTVHCGNMSIGFFGMNVLNPIQIDLSNAFVCNSTKNLIGMNSSLKKWNKLINDLHLGGAADYIEITIPVAYSASNTLNWTDDSGAGGQDVDSYVSCSGNSSRTVCRIPVSMGFSAYTVTTPVSSPGSPGSGPGGGGGGGGGDTKVNTTQNASSESPVRTNLTDSGENGKEGAEDKGIVGNIGDSVGAAIKSLDWKIVFFVFVGIGVCGFVVWYVLKDKRKKFFEVVVKKR